MLAKYIPSEIVILVEKSLKHVAKKDPVIKEE